MIEVDVLVEDPRFGRHRADWQSRAEHCTASALANSAFAGLVDAAGLFDLSIRLSSDASVRILNRDSRGKDSATNILSFQYIDDPQPAALAASPGATLGDLILGYETIATEAQAQRKSFDAHASHLIVHGVLHLLGYDHIDDAQADTMEACERRALADVGLPDPYSWTADPSPL